MMNNRNPRLTTLIVVMCLLFLFLGLTSITSFLGGDKSDDETPIDPYLIEAESYTDSHLDVDADSVNTYPSDVKPVSDSTIDVSTEQSRKPGYVPDRKPTPSRQSVLSAYDDGYQEGYDQGCEDALMGEDFGNNFDDENDYNGRENAQYCEGYEDGYENGFYDHVN
ncbi:MAG: hypothetical protein ACI4AK_06470 [Lepagella sp.]